MFLRFDPNKIALPPILGGLSPQNHLPTTPLPGSSVYDARYNPVTSSGSLPPKTFNPGKTIERVARHKIAAKQDNHGIVSKKRLKQFDNRDQLIEALGNSFRGSQIVDFAACYCTHEPGVTHKQRIQTMTHDIWKATGYRFTVKDHPRAKNGHKTRLWCSQDESHKSKPSKAVHTPRIASDGMVMAKTRYPCRSGLLISSRDDEEPGVSHVVVRMHHHLAHEPYYDHTLPPEMTQSIWQNLQKPMGVSSAPAFPAPPCAAPPPIFSPPAPVPTSDLMEDDDSDDCDPGVGTDLSNQAGSSSVENSPSVSPQEASIATTLTPELFQQRMRKHIADIRDFCCGLEYQLQFNDYKLLEVLESEGSQFLKLVHQCLESEGRLRDSEGHEESSIAQSTAPESKEAIQ